MNRTALSPARPATTRYRRTAAPLRRPLDDFSSTVAELESEAEWRDVAPISPAPTGRLSRARRASTRGIAVLAAVLSATLGVGIFSTTAYFTDAKAVAATVSMGSVDVEVRSVSGKTLTEEPLVVKGLAPLSAAAAADNTRGALVSFKVKPATLNTRGVITAYGVAAGSTTDLMQYVRVNTSVDGGQTWTTAAPLPVSEPVHRSQEFVLPKRTSESDLSGVFTVRFFLAADTPDKFQGAKLNFVVGVKTIQSSAPAGTVY